MAGWWWWEACLQGEVLKSVVALDLVTQSWNGLPDLGTARHGMAVAGVGKTVYAIGGSTGVGDGQVTSSAEALKLAPRKPQPASEWRSLPDAPTARLMMAWTVLGDEIWIAGGMRHGETLQTVESYDTTNGNVARAASAADSPASRDGGNLSR